LKLELAISGWAIIESVSWPLADDSQEKDREQGGKKLGVSSGSP
jgi:hypothetical protein